MMSEYLGYLVGISGDNRATILIFSRRSLASPSLSVSFFCARVKKCAIALPNLRHSCKNQVGPSFEASKSDSQDPLVLGADAKKLLLPVVLQF